MTDTMATLREVHKNLTRAAKSTLVRCVAQGREFLPIVYALRADGEGAVFGASFDREAKRPMYNLLGAALREAGVVGLVLINDMWYLDRKGGDYDPTAPPLPSESADRKEALTVILVTRDGRMDQHLYPYHREDNRVVWETKIVQTGLSASTNRLVQTFIDPAPAH